MFETSVPPLSWDLTARRLHGKVVVVGDVLLDRFVYGAVHRISPEAPVPVLHRSHASTMLGGAGNVAANVASLGGRVQLVGVVGADGEAAEVEHLCVTSGLQDVRLIADAARPTSVKTRLIAHQQQVLRIDVESTDTLEAQIRAKLEDAVDDVLADVQLLVLSDYGKGVLGGGGAERLISRARQAGIPVVVDPKGSDYSRYAGATYITPNLAELREASGMPVATEAQVEAAARRLLLSLGLEAVVATRSEKGISVVWRDDAFHIPTEAREVFDVSGAGDTVVAALALSLAGGAPLAQAAIIANIAAGLAVSKLGTAQVSLGEMADAVRERGSAPFAGDGAATDLLLAEWRRRGLRIGFTNGCFDLVHPGHIALLANASRTCDRLIVGLNCDASVRRLKGPGRPVNSQDSRLIVLQALRPVDLVVIFDDDTPEQLIHAIKPDVLIKGADYALDQIVGADFVMSYGGHVELVPLVAGQSSTATLSRAADSV